MAASRIIGLISDTHGLLRDEAVAALQGSEAIIHAGDIGDPMILHELEQIAPVYAVRGNNDHQKWAQRIPEELQLDFAGFRIFVIHNIRELKWDPAAKDFQVVISGHSHRPVIQQKNGALFINPGSAGPRRFQFPVSAGRLIMRGKKVSVELMDVLLQRSIATYR